MIVRKGLNIYVSPGTKYRNQLQIGHCTLIGEFEDSQNIIDLGENLIIGSFCKIGKNVSIGNNCIIEDNCYVYHDTKIGNNVRLVSGSRISARCTIGDNAIINGIISQRVILEENVRFFGRTAHSHYNHTLSWTKTIEPSPIFRKGCIVGVNALIIGAVEIGENTYISAGEIVRSSIPPESVFYRGKVYTKSHFRGLII